MQDQLAVRVRHGGEHVEEQPHARVGRRAPRVAPAVDRLALDVLEHEVRLAAGVHAGVDQPRDVRMRRGAPSALPSRRKRSMPPRPEQRQVEQLDRDARLVAPVAAVREPHRAHAALAEQPLERVAADDLTRRASARARPQRARCLREIPRARCRRAAPAGRSSSSATLGVGRGAAAPGAPARAGASSVQQLVEQRAERCPARLVEATLHGSLQHVVQDTGAPCSSRAAPCAPRRRACAAISAKEKPQKNLQVDQLRERGIDAGQLVERIADALAVRAPVARRSRQPRSASSVIIELAAALQRAPLAHEVDDQAAHRARCIGHEPRAIGKGQRVALRRS